MPLDARSEALAALARFQVTDVTVGDTLQRLAEITIAAMPSVKVAGMTMLDNDGTPTTAIYTDELSPEVDESQYRSGRGPCLDAWREKRVVRVDDTAQAATDYPEFSAASLAHGVRSTLSLPLVSGELGMGAMNLYAASENAFSDDDEQLGQEIAGAVAVVLANVTAYRTAFVLNEQLSEAIRSRAIIEQAKGMLMARAPELSPDDAFDILRKASQRENVKLRQIAERIVERKPLPG